MSMGIISALFGVVPLREHRTMKRRYIELLKRKDTEIDGLKEENALLLGNALRQVEKRRDAVAHGNKLVEINKVLMGRLKK